MFWFKKTKILWPKSRDKTLLYGITIHEDQDPCLPDPNGGSRLEFIRSQPVPECPVPVNGNGCDGERGHEHGDGVDGGEEATKRSGLPVLPPTRTEYFTKVISLLIYLSTFPRGS